MPGYHWKGVTERGVKIEGDLNAASKEGAVEQLRRQQIRVRKIVETSAGGVVDTRPHEPSSRAPRFTRFRSLFIAAMFAAAALAVGVMAPITVWTCSREPGGAVTCSISESSLGLIELRSQRLSNASSVDLETEAVTIHHRMSDLETVQRRIVFSDAQGASIRSTTWSQGRPREWFRNPPVASPTVMFEEFQRFFRDGTESRRSTWGMFWVPSILIAVFLFFALVMVAVTVASLFIRPEWAQAKVDELRKHARGRARRSAL